MKLFVGNLDYEVTEEELRDFFASIGNVASAKVITDRYTSRPRGFGFVEMSTEEEGNKAIEELDGAMLNNRPIAVKKALAEERSGGPRRHDRQDRRDRY